MLHILPAELTLKVLSHLPITSLLSLPALSRQWFHFFATHQSAIFYSAAVQHEYIQPGTSLEDALSVNTGRPWEGSESWKDFCCRSLQFSKNWEGKGRTVARVISDSTNTHCLKVDEKAGICVMTHQWGGLTVTHLFSSTILWSLPKSYVRPCSHIEYDNGFLVFDKDGDMEVWRLDSDFSEGEVALDAPPNLMQMVTSASAAELYEQYAPRGQFRPWALLEFPDSTTSAYRLMYPTLICASNEQAFLHDVRTGSLVQTVDLNLQTLCSVDLSERHIFVCEYEVLHVFSRESGFEVLRIPAFATVRCNLRVEDPFLVSGDWLVTPLSVSPEVDESPRQKFIDAQVSRDGRDLVVLSETHRVVFIRDFECICRGETTFERAGHVLDLRPEDICYYLGFEHARVCVATIHGLYVFTFGLEPDLSAKAVFVRPSDTPTAISRSTGCIQLTERRIYFTWEDSGRREDIMLFRDNENNEELPPPTIPMIMYLLQLEAREIFGLFEKNSLGCIDFSLMLNTEGYESDDDTS
ncbi:hypothetical protein V8E53_001333 [Lactarius tabidus]